MKKQKNRKLRKIILITALYLIALPPSLLWIIEYYDGHFNLTPSQLPAAFSIVVSGLAAPLYVLMVRPILRVKGNPFQGPHRYKNFFIVCGVPVIFFFTLDLVVYPVGKHLLLNSYGTTVEAYPIDAYFVYSHGSGAGNPASNYKVNDLAHNYVHELIVVYRVGNDGATTQISYEPASHKPVDNGRLQTEQLKKALYNVVTIKYVRFAPYISTLE